MSRLQYALLYILLFGAILATFLWLYPRMPLPPLVTAAIIAVLMPAAKLGFLFLRDTRPWKH
jgi:hypothetical protein